MQNVLTGKEVQENGFSKMCIKFSERKYRHFLFRHSDFLYFKSHLPLLPRSKLNQPITPRPQPYWWLTEELHVNKWKYGEVGTIE